MSKSSILSALLSGAALVYSGTSLAAEDPKPSQVYEALRAHHVAEAEQMIDQALRAHPRSGEAHYVAAEVYAAAGNFGRARSELAAADQLEPGLPFLKNQSSATELRNELSSNRVPQVWTPVEREGARPSGLPWGIILAVLIGIGVVWMLIRRRVQMSSYSNYQGNVPPPMPGQPGYGVPPMGAGPYYPGGAGGSGMLGSLGTGLAIGAGVAAGEELVHHVLDGNHPQGGIISSANADELSSSPPPNSDLGGQDFGLNDASSWDDSSSSDGGFDSGSSGGDDWT
jgi:hypothetical protein